MGQWTMIKTCLRVSLSERAFKGLRTRDAKVASRFLRKPFLAQPSPANPRLSWQSQQGPGRVKMEMETVSKWTN